MSIFSVEDSRYMARALQLAARGLYTADPNPRVGCVLVKDGHIVGEGWHERAGEAHAEVRALLMAGDRAKGATAYITLEPCAHQGRTPPCSRALLKAGIARVVAAMEDPNPLVSGRGLAELKANGVQVAWGLMAKQATELNPGFVKRMREKRPYVRCKLGVSLDGRTAMPSGESKWITGEAARADVQRLRARSSAVMTGIGTVLADDPNFTVRPEQFLGERYPGGTVRQPLRVVVDPHLSMPEKARMLTAPGKTLIATSSDDQDVAEVLQGKGAEVMRFPGTWDTVDLASVLDLLATREVNEVLVETGATLAGSLLKAGLVDELVVYLAPLLMGDGARGMFRLPGLTLLEDAIQLEIRDVRPLGRDWRVEAVVAPRR